MNNGIDTSKKVFMTSLNREQQLGMLFDMCQALSNSQAIDGKDHVLIKQDITYIKGELAGIGRRGEDPTLDTEEKFDLLMSKRFDWSVWFRDRVLPQIITFITVAILALTFGKSLMNLLP